jgi:hypothetical protein
MKRGVILLSVISLIIGLAVSGFIDGESQFDTIDSAPGNDSTNKELSELGINGGITVDYKTGMVTEFVSSNAGLNLFYLVQGGNTRRDAQQIYSRTTTEQTLSNAKSVEDLIENYPSSWIKDYRSVDIEFSTEDEIITLSSPNNKLTEEQQKILQTLKTTSGISVTVNYNKKNYNDHIEKRQMNVSMVVVPEIEAEYKGGYNAMITYLKESSKDEIAAKNFNLKPQPTINFVVNENGVTENIKLIRTSSDKEIDKLLIDLVRQMPKWTPAKNAKGENVKQEFVFNVGQDGC